MAGDLLLIFGAFKVRRHRREIDQFSEIVGAAVLQSLKEGDDAFLGRAAHRQELAAYEPSPQASVFLF